jgi:hypothetical protein
MLKNYLLALLSLSFIATSAYSGDLYLLQIDSKEKLNIVKGAVENAYGMIDDNFIVVLDIDQVDLLKSAGIELELVEPNVDLSKLCQINWGFSEKMQKETVFKALYGSGNDYLAQVDEQEIENLREDGYFIIPLAGKKTPFFFKPVTISLAYSGDLPNDSLVNRVRQDSLYSYNHRLELFQTRYMYSDSVYAARDWLIDKFKSFGYTNVYTDTFYVGVRACHNVICMKPSSSQSDALVVVGGHYDSISNKPDSLAPGADDNGSGTSAVLELARILYDMPMKKNIMFVAFCAEETGLHGSYYLANKLYSQDANLEGMINFDMIGYTDDSDPDIAFYTGSSRAISDVLYASALRVTELNPRHAGSRWDSDHAPFLSLGYDAVFVHEGDFNTPNYHKVTDLTSNMDFSYMTEVLKMAAAGMGQVDLAAQITNIDIIYDAGDGQSLRIVWQDDCQSGYSYKLFYGTQSKTYTDSIDVSAGTCQVDVADLAMGQRYYFAVKGTNSEGFGPMSLTENSAIPYVIPQPPLYLTAEPDTGKISLTWLANRELDLNHYVILRRPAGGDWWVMDNNFSDTLYVDKTVVSHLIYEYKVLAVDNDGKVSDSSLSAKALMPSFDGGILFVDETSTDYTGPDEAEQTIFYDSIFKDYIYYEYDIDSSPPVLTRATVGQYSSIFWIDDDLSSHFFDGSMDTTINWFLSYDSANLLLAGFQTIVGFTPLRPLGSTDFAYRNFGISRVYENQSFDFTGATGHNGWPTLQVDPQKHFSGKLANISVFDTLSGVEVIYTYNSLSGDTAYQGKPAGVAYNKNGSKRIALSFPIDYLHVSDARAFIEKAVDCFEENQTQQPYGDANGDWTFSIVDIIFLTNYLYKAGLAPSNLDFADPNGSCDVNVADAIYLTNFLFKNGPAAKQGCVP